MATVHIGAMRKLAVLTLEERAHKMSDEEFHAKVDELYALYVEIPRWRKIWKELWASPFYRLDLDTYSRQLEKRDPSYKPREDERYWR